MLLSFPAGVVLRLLRETHPSMPKDYYLAELKGEIGMVHKCMVESFHTGHGKLLVDRRVRIAGKGKRVIYIQTFSSI